MSVEEESTQTLESKDSVSADPEKKSEYSAKKDKSSTNGSISNKPPTYKVGDTVYVRKGAKWKSGRKVPLWVSNSSMRIIALDHLEDCCSIGKYINGTVAGEISFKYLDKRK